MIALDLDEVAASVGGELVLPAGMATPGAVAGSVTVDSRAVGAGDLFVALPGERVDGADFVPAAAAAGAVAAVTTRPDASLACVVVADPVQALGRLAAAVRAARAGDTLLVAGKGHETGQEVGNRVLPFDDRAVLREVLAELLSGPEVTA